MKTLADLKRNAQNYTWEMAYNSWFGGELQPHHKFYKLQRTVGKVQSNSLAFNTECSKSGLSWLDWPKATDISIAPLIEGGKEFVLRIEPKDSQDCRITYILKPLTITKEGE